MSYRPVVSGFVNVCCCKVNVCILVESTVTPTILHSKPGIANYLNLIISVTDTFPYKKSPWWYTIQMPHMVNGCTISELQQKNESNFKSLKIQKWSNSLWSLFEACYIVCVETLQCAQGSNRICNNSNWIKMAESRSNGYIFCSSHVFCYSLYFHHKSGNFEDFNTFIRLWLTCVIHQTYIMYVSHM